MSIVIQELKAYFKTRFERLKYETIDTATAIIAEMIVQFVIVFTLAMAFIMLTVAFGFFLAGVLKSYWAGFGIVMLVYLLIVVFGHLLKKPFQNRMLSYLIKKLL